MYNLTVAVAHTYFVGVGQWAVHNTCKPDDPPINRLIQGANPGPSTKGKTVQYVRRGGLSAAERDFNSLGLENITSYSNGTRVGMLPDGRSVNLRTGSSFGAPTIEVQTPGTKRILKFRYEE